MIKRLLPALHPDFDSRCSLTDGGQVPIPSTAALLRSLAIAAAACALLASPVQHRTSTNGGTSWSAASSGASVAVSAQGTALVQFRSVDGAGNVSARAPATPGAADTVMLDRTPPTALSVLAAPGGCVAGPVTLTATGSTDPLSGLDHYESTVNGGALTQGANVVLSGHGTFTVKLRAVDAVGNATAWATTTACLS